jgi:hypothetical protein
MKIYIYLFFFTFSTFLAAQEYERNVMVEVFTNSHCPLCPPAHSTIEAYIANQPGGENLEIIFYHMVFPYSDDPLNQANPVESAERNNFYGPFTSTPQIFFDGETQAKNYSSWASIIDSKLTIKSPAKINLSGSVSGDQITINTETIFGINIPSGQAIINIIAVESLFYQGRNGISDHINVMRKMLTNPTGEDITSSGTQNVSKTVTVLDSWNVDQLEFVVFVQNESTKEVYQSASISYDEISSVELSATNMKIGQVMLDVEYVETGKSTLIEFRVDNDSSFAAENFVSYVRIWDSKLNLVFSEDVEGENLDAFSTRIYSTQQLWNPTLTGKYKIGVEIDYAFDVIPEDDTTSKKIDVILRPGSIKWKYKGKGAESQ